MLHAFESDFVLATLLDATTTTSSEVPSSSQPSRSSQPSASSAAPPVHNSPNNNSTLPHSKPQYFSLHHNHNPTITQSHSHHLLIDSFGFDFVECRMFRRQVLSMVYIPILLLTITTKCLKILHLIMQKEVRTQTHTLSDPLSSSQHLQTLN
jgi:hypothetical protein